MNTLYNFATGPLAWAAFVIFIGGSAYRIWSMIKLARQKEAAFISYMSLPHAMRSIFRWLTPFGTLGWKENPAITVATFLFHICLFALAIFTAGHEVLWDYAFGISFPSLPQGVSDVLTLIVIGACIYFAYRRLTNAQVSFVTTSKDWLALSIAAAPFITGFLASQQFGNGQIMTLLHVLSGEVMLVAIPFTRLSHALFQPLTRAYIASEFGAVRHVQDW
jgi:nitrate reductase gamma subunit